MSTTATQDRTRARLTRITELLTSTTGTEWTFGYIGNCDHQHDDRSWFLFRAHPGRVGTFEDRIGGVATQDLDKLADMGQGALKMARMLKGAS